MYIRGAMFSRESLNKYDSFMLCDTEDEGLFVSAICNAEMSLVKLSLDKRSNSLVETLDISAPSEYSRVISADRAFEILSESFS